jgi:hypothetical protein
MSVCVCVCFTFGGGVDDVGGEVGEAVDAPDHEDFGPFDELDGVGEEDFEGVEEGNFEGGGAGLVLDDGFVDDAVWVCVCVCVCVCYCEEGRCSESV